MFPSVTGDLFGKKYATTNYGIVYTAKGLASIFLDDRGRESVLVSWGFVW